MSKFVLAEQGKPVAGLAPVDIGGAANTSDYFSMENYSHASIIDRANNTLLPRFSP